MRRDVFGKIFNYETRNGKQTVLFKIKLKPEKLLRSKLFRRSIVFKYCAKIFHQEHVQESIEKKIGVAEIKNLTQGTYYD